MGTIVRAWVGAVNKAIGKGFSFEQTLEEAARSGIAAQMPKEGPGAGFLRLNVERLYRVLKRQAGK